MIVIGRLIEEGVDLVELLVRQRVVLVRVALRATPGLPHPHLARRRDAVADGDVAILLVVGAPFGVGHRVPMKSRGD